MPVEKKDPSFGSRFILPLLCIFLMAALCGAVAMRFTDMHKSWLGLWPFGLVVLFMLVALFALHHFVVCRYRCPQCRARLPIYREDAVRADEYRYYCKSCDVIWNTGLRQGEG